MLAAQAWYHVVAGIRTGITKRDAVSGALRGSEKGSPELRGYPTQVGSSSESTDETVAAKLWQVSEDLVGLEFAL